MYCTNCGTEKIIGAKFCVSCGEPGEVRTDRSGDQLLGRRPPTMLRSAYWSREMAFWGVFFWPLGLIAFTLGLHALPALSRYPKRTGRGRAWTGIIMGTLETALAGAVTWYIFTL